MIKNLILTGGQIRGLGYIGVLKAMEELNILPYIENICGISSGSIFALTYCLEFNSKELKDLVLKVNIDDLKENYSENLFKIIYDYGLDSGIKFERLIKIVLKKKLGNENSTFQDLHNFNPKKNLTVVGSNLTTMKTEYFSLENTPNMEIWKAVRISISFPVIFNKFDYQDNIYVDGGLTDNYPMEYFLDDIDNTIGICINSCKTLPEMDNFVNYLIRIVYILGSRKQQEACVKHKDNTIVIDVDVPITSLDFDEKTKSYLIDQGYQQFMEQIVSKKIYKKYVLKDIIKDVKFIIDNIIDNLI